ncbi:unnamed protein product [Caenorhabditis nigoni]
MCFPNSDQDNGRSRPDDAATTTSEWPMIRSPAVTEELKEVDTRKPHVYNVHQRGRKVSSSFKKQKTSRNSNIAPPHTAAVDYRKTYRLTQSLFPSPCLPKPSDSNRSHHAGIAVKGCDSQADGNNFDGELTNFPLMPISSLPKHQSSTSPKQLQDRVKPSLVTEKELLWSPFA